MSFHILRMEVFDGVVTRYAPDQLTTQLFYFLHFVFTFEFRLSEVGDGQLYLPLLGFATERIPAPLST